MLLELKSFVEQQGTIQIKIGLKITDYKKHWEVGWGVGFGSEKCKVFFECPRIVFFCSSIFHHTFDE
jgi:hypothetical protein